MTNVLDNYKEAYEDSFPYALDNELLLNWYAGRILKHAKGSSLLELGIGHGYTTSQFSKLFDRHIVIEGSKEIINSYVQKNPQSKTEIIHSYFENYNTDEKFDIIVMGFILEHVDNPSQILNKFKSFLKPGGSVFISVPNSEALNKRFGLEAGLIDDLNELSPADIQLGHKRLFNLDSLTSLAQNSGYRVVLTEGIFLKPITTQQIIQLALTKNILDAMLKVGVNYPELCVAILMEIEAINQ